MVREFYRKITIPNQVYDEIGIGREKGFNEIEFVDLAIKESWIAVEEVSESKVKAMKFNLGKGEKAALALCKESGGLLLTNDIKVQRISSMLGIPTVSILSH